MEVLKIKRSITTLLVIRVIKCFFSRDVCTVYLLGEKRQHESFNKKQT